MKQKVFSYIREQRLIEKDDNIVVGVSGGADSVCLLYILCEYKKEVPFNIFAVHINHNIRGEEALRDEQYVENLCKALDVHLDIYSCDIIGLAKANKLSVEEQGRVTRYQKFREVLDNNGGGKIAVAHHMNDQAETILFNMIRGSGLKGISGMKPQNKDVIRPLLNTKREDIEKYLSLLNVKYCTDSTNLCDDYMRNKLRLRLIPYIEENINNNFVKNVNEMSEILRETDDFIANETDKLYKASLLEIGSDSVIFDIAILKDAHKAIIRQVIRKSFSEIGMGLKDIGKVHTEDVIKLLEKDSGKSIMLPNSYIASNTYGKLCICKQKRSNTNEAKITSIAIEPNNTYIEKVTKKVISVKLINWNNGEKISSNDYTKMFDYDTISGTLQIRARQTGDYLIINSQGKKKTLKSYYIDEKIPREERDTTLVVAENDSVLWVVGHRISEKYKISENTKRVLCISIMEE